ASNSSRSPRSAPAPASAPGSERTAVAMTTARPASTSAATVGEAMPPMLRTAPPAAAAGPLVMAPGPGDRGGGSAPGALPEAGDSSYPPRRGLTASFASFVNAPGQRVMDRHQRHWAPGPAPRPREGIRPADVPAPASSTAGRTSDDRVTVARSHRGRR